MKPDEEPTLHHPPRVGFKSVLSLKRVVRTVVMLINFIRARKPNQRQFLGLARRHRRGAH